MRVAAIGFLVAMSIAAASPTLAQGLNAPLDAPVSAPGGEPSKPAEAARPARHAAARRAKVSATTRRTSVPASARLPAGPSPSPAAAGALATPPSTDPVSFGMKWNGSNDTPGQTRIENLGGHAAGTGAEVGMKLHF